MIKVQNDTPEEVIDTPEEVKINEDQQPHISVETTPKVVPVPANYEISLKFRNMRGRNKVVVDHIFAYTIASEIINDIELEPQSIDKCRHNND